MLWTRRQLFALGASALASAGCAIGPREVKRDRLRYNEVVKDSDEQQLLLNIVRLRYTDSPSSLAISSVADQYELTRNLGMIPFFTSAAAGQAFGGYRGVVLPQAQLTAVTRPTLTLTPEDSGDFTRRLYTPLSLEAIASLARTTWPTSTVLRMWLENLNWVSNAETGSGPTPHEPPQYAEFLTGVLALKRMNHRKLSKVFAQEAEDPVGDEIPPEKITAEAVANAAKNDLEFHKVAGTGNWRLIKKKQTLTLRFNESVLGDPDFQIFCQSFHLDPTRTSFEMTAAKVDPFLKDVPKQGLNKLDLETRSLLQVLFFLAHGLDVPEEHIRSGVAPVTHEADGTVFDWQQVLVGLFRVYSAAGKQPPECAYVAVHYRGYWFYLDDRDRETKATFTLLLETSRLQLSADKGGAAPVLTLPIGGR
jgi:hypothetical protein